MIAFSFQIDPHLVLGVPHGASLQDIRDAYRTQAKKFHPDAGGTDWTFRVLVQAYEILSTARVEQASRNESQSNGWSTPPSDRNDDEPNLRTGGNGGTTGQSRSNGNGSVNDGVDPSRIVSVERLSVRYEAEPLWLVAESAREEHSLSCSLNFKWPDQSDPCHHVSGPECERLLGRLTEVFEAMCLKTQVVTSRIRLNENSFTGWLSYPSVERASVAYRLLHGMLKAHGFEVNPWTRDLVIPRTWR